MDSNNLANSRRLRKLFSLGAELGKVQIPNGAGRGRVNGTGECTQESKKADSQKGLLEHIKNVKRSTA